MARPATPIDHLAVSLPTTNIPATNIDHPADYTNNDDHTHQLWFFNLWQINCHFVILLSRLCFLHCSLAVIIRMLNSKIICEVDVLIGSATTLSVFGVREDILSGPESPRSNICISIDTLTLNKWKGKMR